MWEKCGVCHTQSQRPPRQLSTPLTTHGVMVAPKSLISSQFGSFPHGCDKEKLMDNNVLSGAEWAGVLQGCKITTVTTEVRTVASPSPRHATLQLCVLIYFIIFFHFPFFIISTPLDSPVESPRKLQLKRSQ